MINNVSAKSAYAFPKQDLQNLARYASGMNIVEKDNGLTLSSLTSYPVTITCYDSYQWLKNNKGNYKEAFKKVTDAAKESRNVLKTSGIKGVLNVSSAKDILACMPDAESLKTFSSTTQDLYKKAQQYAQIAANAPKDAKGAVKVAKQAFAEAKAAAYSEAAKNATGIFGKAKNALGITKITNGVNKLATKSPVFNSCLEAYRNESGTFMLVLEGGIEVATNVVPTFKKLGAKRGFKQLGKSATTTVSSVAGWVAGSAVGSKLGKVIKAACGGNKAGALIGVLAETVCSYIGGSLGQHFATKGANKLVGKSELEKAKEEEVQALAELAEKDEQVLTSLMEAAANRYQMEGVDNAETEMLKNSIGNIVKSQMPSEMLNQEQLARVAASLEDNQPAQQVAQAVSTKATTSERAEKALANADAYMDKISKTLLK